MKKINAILILVLMAAPAREVRAAALMEGMELRPGGRFEHFFQIEESWSPYPWNFDSSAPTNRSRLMLDLGIAAPRYGMLYVKGDALWETGRTADGHALFKLRQGDYRRAWRRNGSSASFMLFANERRFFTGGYLAPLLADDAVDDTGDNRGVRLDLSIRETVRFTSVFATLGDGWDDARKISFLRSAVIHRVAQFSLSYRYDVPALDQAMRQALLKSELVCFYKKASLLFSYEQSRFQENGLFLPRLSLDTNGFVGDNFSSMLPDEGAFFAQARLTPLPIRDWGTVTVVHDYFAVGEEFVNDLGLRSGERVGYLFGAYFRALAVDMNGRVRFGKRVRSKLENEKREHIDASLWGSLRNGVDVTVRGGWSKTSDKFSFEPAQNHFLGTVNFHSKKMRNGFHVLVRDMDTVRASRSLAWDSRVVLNSDFAVDWRYILAGEEDVRDTVFFRLAFRPSQRLYAYASYGRQSLGDGPFLLEDEELFLTGVDPSLYTISIRGDF